MISSGRVARLADLLQHHLALAFELDLIESRPRENVGKNVDRERHVGLQHARMKCGLFAARIGVEESADRFDLFGNVARATAIGTFERHVFEHMRDAHLATRFGACAAIHPTRPPPRSQAAAWDR